MATLPKIKPPKQLASLLARLKPVTKHHYFIVTVVLFGSVAYGVFAVNQILGGPADEEYRTKQMQSTIGNKFNKSAQDTIDKIKDLHKSTDAASSQEPFPGGRINPFAE